MKIPFDQINGLLEDPFFEMRTLGTKAILQRIAPLCNFDESPVDLRFIDWEPEDIHETVRYSFHDTMIGRILIASTTKGLCFLGFIGNSDADNMKDFLSRFPLQPMEETADELHKLASGYCNGIRGQVIPLHLRGSDFQVGIWKELVRIPEGCVATYGSLTGNRGYARAAGTAVGANPVSYIIPCHRVVKSDGDIRGYHWGDGIKKQLLVYELHR